MSKKHAATVAQAKNPTWLRVWYRLIAIYALFSLVQIFAGPWLRAHGIPIPEFR